MCFVLTKNIPSPEILLSELPLLMIIRDGQLCMITLNHTQKWSLGTHYKYRFHQHLYPDAPQIHIVGEGMDN